MQSIDLISTYTYAGDAVTVFMSLSLIIVIREALYFSNDRNFNLLKQTLIWLFVAAMSNGVFGGLCKVDGISPIAIFIARDVYHITVLCVLFMFILYVRNLLELPEKTYKIVTRLTEIAFFLGTVFDVLSPLTHFGFYYENGLWFDSTYIKPYTMVYGYSLAIMGYMLLFHGDRMIKSVRNALITIEIICVGIDLVENVVDSNTFATFTFMIPIIAVLILLHSMPYDAATGAMGTAAYIKFLSHNEKKKVDYMILKLADDSLQDMPKALAKALRTFWNTSFKKAFLFALHGNIFVLAIEQTSKGNHDKITNLADNIFPAYYDQFKIDYKGIMLFDVNYISSLEDMNAVLAYFLNICQQNEFLYPDEKQVANMSRVKTINEALADINAKCDLDDERVLAFCQPVKNVATGKFDTAEILMRIKLPDIGMIFPDQFIPIAETNGYIHTLSKIILNKSCKQLKEMLSQGYQVTRISVNFTVPELRESDFCQEMLNIIQSNNVDPEKIAIELTESQSESDFAVVYSTVEQLRKHGIKFYLDDFGTGYSNLGRILHLNFDIIKFDRSLLLYADEGNDGRYILKQLSEIFESLNYKILYEGVENEDNEKLCVEYHADYLQGYKFSKPIPFLDAKNFFEKI